jgi:cyclopropane-fatty-acyl-phospholipid synthase
VSLTLDLVDRGVVPDSLIRWGIRRQLKSRLSERRFSGPEERERAVAEFAESLRTSPVAIETEKANEQHYEVPAGFFQKVLGRHLKYSSCYYPTGKETLDEAEAIMLGLTCERADLVDGQDVLELGCGWGSLTLWMAANYPSSRITAVSNSNSQREFILGQAKERGLGNVEVITADANHFDIDRKFDRVVSVEMFEHLRNYETIFERISNWLRADGRLFIHIFCHKERPYTFDFDDRDNAGNWMGRHFFTGGLMPSDDLLLHFHKHLELEERWTVDGNHYAQTSEHWLQNLDAVKQEVMPVLAETYGPDQAATWFQRWRVFFLSCAELFGYRDGHEWWVSHYRFRPVT